ncbi:MAG: DoxX-like family protein [Pseudomonadota bacterium]|nr:DoxX-like family protein [Pseudomonadota bacterium]
MFIQKTTPNAREALSKNKRTPRTVPASLRPLHASVCAVWLLTALISLWEARTPEGQSFALLRAAGLHSPVWMSALIAGGAALDAAVGLWLWRRPGRASALAALALMALFTLVATALQPALWLHPLGPLLKNLPLAAALWLLACADPAPRQEGHTT